MTKKPGNVPFVQSLDRGLTILQTVARSKQPVTLGELAELLEVLAEIRDHLAAVDHPAAGVLP